VTVVVPAVTVGKPVVTTNVPAPVLSVVTWPTVVVPITTSIVLLTGAPVTLSANVVAVTPCFVTVLKVAVPLALLFWSVSAAVRVVCCDESHPPSLLVGAANAPPSEPTVTAVLAVTPVGTVVKDFSVPVGFVEKTAVAAPVLSVVTWPIVVVPITTSSVVLAVAPVTLSANVVAVTPCFVTVLKVAVPLALLFWSVSAAVRVVCCDDSHPPSVFVGAANAPLSEPIVMAVLAATPVGAVVNACSVPVGFVEKTAVAAPVLSVVIWPTVVVPITTFSVLLAAAPVTLTFNSLSDTPSSVPVL
jgi:hypothetical protein